MEQTAHIIIRPIITEQSLKDAQAGSYTFLVGKQANKYQIAQALKQMFGVDTTNVSTNNVKKKKIVRTRMGIRQTDNSYKKARVQLKKGQKIELFEEVMK